MEVLGVSAEDLGKMKESDEQAFDNVLQQATFKEYVFRVRAKVDTYNVRTFSLCLSLSLSLSLSVCVCVSDIVCGMYV